jgi:hypothetical protein
MQVLGTPIETIIETEDRELFSRKLLQINESLALSYSATSLSEALRVAEKVPFTHTHICSAQLHVVIDVYGSQRICGFRCRRSGIRCL